MSDLSKSEMTNVKIDGIKLNGSILFNAKWSNLVINELHSFIDHNYYVKSLSFSPDGNKIASVSVNYTIRLWDVKTE